MQRSPLWWYGMFFVAVYMFVPAAMAPELLSFLVTTTALLMVAIVARRLRLRPRLSGAA